MSFSFNGTAVEIFGARRDNHGDYQITIDNVTSTISGLSNPNVFKTSLFSISNLTQGLHTVTLTNKPTDNNHKFVDIDFVGFNFPPSPLKDSTLELKLKTRCRLLGHLV